MYSEVRNSMGYTIYHVYFGCLNPKKYFMEEAEFQLATPFMMCMLGV